MIYGHSAGAGGAIIAASRNQERIHTLFLEACYAHTEAALLSLYRWFNPFFGYFLGPMVIFWMNRFYHNGLKRVSPARLAPQITIPTLIIHGEKDQRFPVTFARELHESFPRGVSEIFVAKGAHHSESSQSEGYREAVRAFLNRAIENYNLSQNKRNKIIEHPR